MSFTKAELQAQLVDCQAAIKRQNDGLAEHARDGTLMRETDMEDLLVQRTTLLRQISRAVLPAYMVGERR